MNTEILTCDTNKSTTHDIASTWCQPTPLAQVTTAEIKYPMDALPAILQKAVGAYHQYGQQPLSLITNSAIANISLACQSQANVARDQYLTSPVSLYFLTCGSSGERKSAVDTVFSRACRQWEQNLRQKRASEITAATLLHETWKMERDAVASQIKRAMLNNEGTKYLKSELASLLQEKPEVPLQPMLYFEDSTQEALASDLAHGWPSASLWSDEAAIVLGSHSMQSNPTRFVALLNRCWDGKALSVQRKTSDNFILENRRLTMNLMMQPLLLQKLANQAQGICRQSGFLARCLIAYPPSTMGHRFYQEPPSSLDGLETYEQHITDCLNYSEHLTREGCINLPTLHFSPAAKHIWITFFNQVETGLKPQGIWCDIKDFASKAAENAARLAALFHLFNGTEGDIQTESTEQAIAIIQWHLEETRRLLAPFADESPYSDAEKLMRWLKSKELQQTTPRAIQQSSPIRQKIQRDNALSVLIEHQWVRLINRGNQTIVEINPNVLTD